MLDLEQFSDEELITELIIQVNSKDSNSYVYSLKIRAEILKRMKKPDS